MQVDLSKLHQDDLVFLTKWAANADLTVEQLVIQILTAACDGDQYLKGRPVDGDGETEGDSLRYG